MDSQPKHLCAVAGGLSLVVCIQQVMGLNWDLSGLSQLHRFCVIVFVFFFCCLFFPQLVLLKDKKKVFTLDNLGYEAEFGLIHPGGTTVAVGGNVSGQTNRSCSKKSYFHGTQTSFLFSFRII